MNRGDWRTIMTAAEESADALDKLASVVDFTQSEEDLALFRRIQVLKRGSVDLYHDARAQR